MEHRAVLMRDESSDQGTRSVLTAGALHPARHGASGPGQPPEPLLHPHRTLLHLSPPLASLRAGARRRVRNVCLRAGHREVAVRRSCKPRSLDNSGIGAREPCGSVGGGPGGSRSTSSLERSRLLKEHATRTSLAGEARLGSLAPRRG